jgi:hypothetical protein
MNKNIVTAVEFYFILFYLSAVGYNAWTVD